MDGKGLCQSSYRQEINDITKDRDDLEAFLLKARDLDVMVYVLNTGVQVKAESDNGAGC